MKKEHIWTCDYCGKEFKTKKFSDVHELKCPKKNREIAIKTKAPTSDTMFKLGSVLIALYFLTFFVISSYAKSNGLPGRDLLQPHKWFGAMPTPTVFIPTPTSDPDPYVPCSWKGVNGEIQCPDKQLRKSECLNSVCCGIGNGKWSSMSKAECDGLRTKATQKVTTDVVTCTFDPRCNQKPLMLKASVCKNTTCCNIALDYWVMTFTVAECKTLQDKAIALYNSIYKNSPPLTLSQYIPAKSSYSTSTNNSPNSAPTQQTQENINPDYGPICRSQLSTDTVNAKQLGGSAGEAMLQLAQNNFDRCMKTGQASALEVNRNLPSPTPTIVGIWYGKLGPQ